MRYIDNLFNTFNHELKSKGHANTKLEIINFLREKQFANKLDENGVLSTVEARQKARLFKDYSALEDSESPSDSWIVN